MSANLERRISAAIIAVVQLLVAVALAGMLHAYLRYARPQTGDDLPTWLAIGFPVALCIGVLHFLRRSFVSWRRFRRS